MKWLTIILLFLTTTVSAQRSLNGAVIIYKESGANTPMEGASIIARGAQPAVSGYLGIYRLDFDKSIDMVKIDFQKKGFEVINAEELAIVDLKSRKVLNIYVDNIGNTWKRRLLLMSALKKAAEKDANARLAVLQGERKDALQLQAVLEKKYKRKFASLYELISFEQGKLEQSFGNIETAAKLIISQNLDHRNKEIEALIKLFKEGRTDEVLRRLNTDSLFVVVKSKLRSLVDDKDKLQFSIPVLIANGMFVQADTAYRLLTQIDTLNLDLRFKYAYFLLQQRQTDRSIAIYKELLKKQYDGESIAASHTNLGHLYEQIGNAAEAERHVREALKIREVLAGQNPKLFLKPLLKAYGNLGTMMEMQGKHDKAIRLFQRGITTIDSLKEGRDDDNQELKASLLDNIGSVYQTMRQFQTGLDYSKKALSIYVALDEHSHDALSNELAIQYNAIAIAHSKLRNVDSAVYYAEKAVEAAEKPHQQNPDGFQEYYVSFLNTLGNAYVQRGSFKTADGIFNKAIAELQRLPLIRQPIKTYQLAETYNNWGTMFQFAGDWQLAVEKYSTSVDYYITALKYNHKYLAKYQQALVNLDKLLLHVREYQTLNTHLLHIRSSISKAIPLDPPFFEPEVLQVNNGLIEVAQLTDEQIDEIALLKESLSLSEKLYGDLQEDYFINQAGDYAKKLSKIYLSLERNEEARTLALTAVKHFTVLKLKEKEKYQTKLDQANIDLADIYGHLAWRLTLEGKIRDGQENAMAGLSYAPDRNWIKINYAHTLLILGNVREAKDIYYLFKKHYIYEEGAYRDYYTAIIQDFNEMKAKGLIPKERLKDLQNIIDNLK